MSVPAHERKQARSEYVNQARFVYSRTAALMRKWPKSRLHTETAFVMQTAYTMLEAALTADCLYAVLPGEHALKLEKLEEAHGKLNMLACLSEEWRCNIPTVGKAASRKMLKTRRPPSNYAEVLAEEQAVRRAEAKKVVDPKTVDAYLMRIAGALRVFSGAIKYQRKQLRESLEKYPQFAYVGRSPPADTAAGT